MKGRVTLANGWEAPERAFPWAPWHIPPSLFPEEWQLLVFGIYHGKRQKGAYVFVSAVSQDLQNNDTPPSNNDNSVRQASAHKSEADVCVKF